MELAPRRVGASLSLELVSVVSVAAEADATAAVARGGEAAAAKPDFVLRSLDAERVLQLQRRRKQRSRVRKALDRVVRVAANFLTRSYFLAHLAWFALLAFVGSLLIFGIERGGGREGRSFVDCLFTTVSAITSAGLTVFDFSTSRGGTQALVLLLIAFGGVVFDGLFLLCLRKLLWKKPALLRTVANNPPVYRESPRGGNDIFPSSASTTTLPSSSSSSSSSFSSAAMSMDGGVVLSLNSHRLAQFHALLTHRQERSALTALIFVFLGYLLSFYGLTFLFLGLYFTISPTYRAIVVSRGVSVWWSALFHAISAMSNAGFSLFSEGLTVWARCPGALIWLSAVIFFGNTGFPVLLHAVVWVVDLILRKLGLRHVTKEHLVNYILKFPRRLTPCMFPRRETLRLLCILALFFVVQFVAMTASNWSYMTANGETLGAGYRIVNVVFQVTSTRMAGFNSLDMSSLGASTLVLTIIAMYVSAVPGVVTMRSTRDRSGENKDLPVGPASGALSRPAPPSSTTQTQLPSDQGAVGQLKRMLLFDTTWIFVPFYLICLFEDAKMRDSTDYTHFRLLFEVVSAYGPIGLSLGFPGIASSYSTVLGTGSKLLLCVVMLVGRHRGFPDRIDQAVLPSCLPVQQVPMMTNRSGSIHSRRRMSHDIPSPSTSPLPGDYAFTGGRPTPSTSPVFD